MVAKDEIQEYPVNEDDGITVDLDLKAEDARLREAIGKPTTIRIDSKVIHIQHVADWSATAMEAAASADWNTWAVEVIPDEKEAQHFIDADLANYQIEAVFDTCSEKGGLGKGKKAKAKRSAR
jgi:hypothetical protein